jgi:hypothetical protein
MLVKKDEVWIMPSGGDLTKLKMTLQREHFPCGRNHTGERNLS